MAHSEIALGRIYAPNLDENLNATCLKIMTHYHGIIPFNDYSSDIRIPEMSCFDSVMSDHISATFGSNFIDSIKIISLMDQNRYIAATCNCPDGILQVINGLNCLDIDELKLIYGQFILRLVIDKRGVIELVEILQKDGDTVNGLIPANLYCSSEELLKLINQTCSISPSMLCGRLIHDEIFIFLK